MKYNFSQKSLRMKKSVGKIIKKMLIRGNELIISAALSNDTFFGN